MLSVVLFSNFTLVSLQFNSSGCLANHTISLSRSLPLCVCISHTHIQIYYLRGLLAWPVSLAANFILHSNKVPFLFNALTSLFYTGTVTVIVLAVSDTHNKHSHTREVHNNRQLWYESEQDFTQLIHSASSTYPPVSPLFTHSVCCSVGAVFAFLTLCMAVFSFMSTIVIFSFTINPVKTVYWRSYFQSFYPTFKWQFSVLLLVVR